MRCFDDQRQRPYSLIVVHVPAVLLSRLTAVEGWNRVRLVGNPTCDQPYLVNSIAPLVTTRFLTVMNKQLQICVQRHLHVRSLQCSRRKAKAARLKVIIMHPLKDRSCSVTLLHQLTDESCSLTPMHPL